VKPAAIQARSWAAHPSNRSDSGARRNSVARSDNPEQTESHGDRRRPMSSSPSVKWPFHQRITHGPQRMRACDDLRKIMYCAVRNVVRRAGGRAGPSFLPRRRVMTVQASVPSHKPLQPAYQGHDRSVAEIIYGEIQSGADVASDAPIPARCEGSIPVVAARIGAHGIGRSEKARGRK